MPRVHERPKFALDFLTKARRMSFPGSLTMGLWRMAEPGSSIPSSDCGERCNNVTHNRCHERFADFKDAVLTFLQTKVPKVNQSPKRLAHHVRQSFR